MRNSKVLALSLAALLSAWSTLAWGYPTSVLRSPTGDTKGFLDINVLIATSYVTSPPRLVNEQRSTVPYPGATRLALLGGLLPPFAYTDGVTFGGLEAGLDFLSADSFGASRIKPLFGAKLSLLAEGHNYPYVALGLMEASTLDHQSLNLGYLSLTKTLRLNGTSFGRVTVGLARTFASESERYPNNCPNTEERNAACMFRGTFPFADSSPYALILGYESPKWGPLLLAFDHTGGHSSVSSTNIGIKLFMSDRITATLVRFWGNVQDHETLSDIGTRDGKPTNGLIVGISATADAITLFRPTPSAAPEPAATVTSPAPAK